MTEVGGKHRDSLLDIGSPAIPAEKRPDCEPMAKVVHARAGVIARPAQANLPRQTPKDTMDILVPQPTAALGDKELRAAA